MNHILSETFNIDTVIQELQTKLYNNLIVDWNTTKLDAYGRVYKNERKGSIIPEVYDASSKSYKEVFYNNQSCFFFVDDDSHSTEQKYEYITKVKVCFMLKLDDIKSSSERVDSDVKRDVVVLLRQYGYDFKITEYLKTIDVVFRDFDTSKLKSSENDMHPLHVFAIEGTLSYRLTDKC